MPTSTLSAQLHALESIGLIQLASSEPEIEYMFRHTLIQEVVYTSLLKQDRKRLHRAVGEALERTTPIAVAARLGFHFAQADLPDKAWRYLTQVGDRAHETHANAEAIDSYRAALREIDALSYNAVSLRNSKLYLHEMLGDILLLIGRASDAALEYHHALECASEPSFLEIARLYRKIGNTRDAQRELDRALQAYDRAEQVLGQQPLDANTTWWQVWAEIQLDRMFIYYWRADWRGIAELADTTRPIIKRYGTALLQARFYDRWAGSLIRRDRYVISDQTLELTQAGLLASEESGNLREITNARFNMGFAHLWRNQLDEAQPYLEKSLQLARETGDVTYQSWCLAFLSVVCRKRGQIDQTRQFAMHVLDVASNTDLTPWIAVAHANLAWVACRTGDHSEAQRIAQMAWESMQALPLVVPFYWLVLWR